MVGVIALVFGLAAFTGTVFGVNKWLSGQPEASPYDIMTAVDLATLKIGSMAEMPYEVSMALAVFALILPAIIVHQIASSALRG